MLRQRELARRNVLESRLPCQVGRVRRLASAVREGELDVLLDVAAGVEPVEEVFRFGLQTSGADVLDRDDRPVPRRDVEGVAEQLFRLPVVGEVVLPVTRRVAGVVWRPLVADAAEHDRRAEPREERFLDRGVPGRNPLEPDRAADRRARVGVRAGRHIERHAIVLRDAVGFVPTLIFVMAGANRADPLADGDFVLFRLMGHVVPIALPVLCLFFTEANLEGRHVPAANGHEDTLAVHEAAAVERALEAVRQDFGEAVFPARDAGEERGAGTGVTGNGLHVAECEGHAIERCRAMRFGIVHVLVEPGGAFPLVHGERVGILVGHVVPVAFEVVGRLAHLQLEQAARPGLLRPLHRGGVLVLGGVGAVDVRIEVPGRDRLLDGERAGGDILPCDLAVLVGRSGVGANTRLEGEFDLLVRVGAGIGEVALIEVIDRDAERAAPFVDGDAVDLRLTVVRKVQPVAHPVLAFGQVDDEAWRVVKRLHLTDAGAPAGGLLDASGHLFRHRVRARLQAGEDDGPLVVPGDLGLIWRGRVAVVDGEGHAAARIGAAVQRILDHRVDLVPGWADPLLDRDRAERFILEIEQPADGACGFLRNRERHEPASRGHLARRELLLAGKRDAEGERVLVARRDILLDRNLAGLDAGPGGLAVLAGFTGQAATGVLQREADFRQQLGAYDQILIERGVLGHAERAAVLDDGDVGSLAGLDLALRGEASWGPVVRDDVVEVALEQRVGRQRPGD